MSLPGGIRVAGRLRRDYRFRPVDGAMELALAESLEGEAGMAARVTRALGASLAMIGGERADERLAASLAVADRQFLMRRLAAHLGRGGQWLSVVCRNCGERFDFHVEHHRLPVKPAGEGFPRVEVRLARGLAVFRAPTGADQEAIADVLAIEGPGAAQRALAQRCLESVDGRAVSGADFTPADLQAIDAAMEAVAPEVATELEAACPHCGGSERIYLDPYQAVGAGGMELFHEIHVLAWHYHWSEAEILAMPRARRRRYLGLIDRARGMSVEASA